MDHSLLLWARLCLRLGLVLLVVGLLPLLAVATIFTGVDPLIPVMLSVSAAPIGALSALAALILFLAALVRRRPKGPS